MSRSPDEDGTALPEGPVPEAITEMLRGKRECELRLECLRIAAAMVGAVGHDLGAPAADASHRALYAARLFYGFVAGRAPAADEAQEAVSGGGADDFAAKRARFVAQAYPSFLTGLWERACSLALHALPRDPHSLGDLTKRLYCVALDARVARGEDGDA